MIAKRTSHTSRAKLRAKPRVTSRRTMVDLQNLHRRFTVPIGLDKAGNAVVLGWVKDDPAPTGSSITPGAGWEEETDQPVAYGSGDFSTATSIARWDVVPYQTFTGEFTVGVVAFHGANIDRVEFAVEGGSWVSVGAMSLNAQVAGNGWDGVWEYSVSMNSNEFSTYGPIELRAIAYPMVGQPYLLPSLWLNVDPDGSVLAARQVRYVDSSADINIGTPAGTFGSQERAVVTRAGSVVDFITVHSIGVSSAHINRSSDTWDSRTLQVVTLSSVVGEISYGDTFKNPLVNGDEQTSGMAVHYDGTNLWYYVNTTYGSNPFASGQDLTFNTGTTATMSNAPSSASLSEIASGDVITGLVSDATVSVTGSLDPRGDNTNDGTENNPFASVKHAAKSIYTAQTDRADNGLIYLKEADYPFIGTHTGTTEPATVDAWLTICGAPGTTRENVRITQGGSSQRLNTSRVHLKNLVVADTLTSSSGVSLNQDPYIWIDGVLKTKYNRFLGMSYSGFAYNWTTNSDIENVLVGSGGFTRNTRIESIGTDSFVNPEVIINVTVSDVNRTGYEAYFLEAPHPDIAQWNAVHANHTIIYGLHATNSDAQGLFFGGINSTTSATNTAIVNCLIDANNNGWGRTNEHLLIWHCTFASSFLFTANETFTNVSIRNNVFSALGNADDYTDQIIDNNHFINEVEWGTNSTPGTITDYGESNGWTPLGALLDRADGPLISVDINNNERLVTDGAIGAIEETIV